MKELKPGGMGPEEELYFNKMVATRQPNMFSVVEVEVNSLCNRSCGYCPQSELDFTQFTRLMKADIFTKLLDDLKEMKFVGRFSYHRFNEPLLRKDLESLVSTAKRALPDSFHVIYTNGDLLNESRYQSLLEAGVDHFLVTRHAGTPIAERKAQTIRFPGELILSNRAGTMSNIKSPEEKRIPMMPCLAPSEMVIVDVDGNILQCYEDAKREKMYGNVSTEALRSIWEKPNFVEARTALSCSGRLNGPSICHGCNNTAHLEKDSSFSI